VRRQKLLDRLPVTGEVLRGSLLERTLRNHASGCAKCASGEGPALPYSGAFGWFHPSSVLTGIGLVLGYALFGAGWLVFRSEGPLREWEYARIPWLVGGVFAALDRAFIASIAVDAGATAQSNLEDRYWGLAFPVLAVVMFWPYMVPYSITVADAAAPDASLEFIFYRGVIVLPVILIYSIGVYYVFYGKARRGYH
jgi:cytochrome bd ubiquinol oxidase subunit II